jgi:hypothetical protein
MPQLLHRLVNHLQADGKSVDSAWAIATSELRKHGDLDAHGQLTAQGAQRQALGAAGRAKLRASKASGGKHAPDAFRYHKGTNRATLK